MSTVLKVLIMVVGFQLCVGLYGASSSDDKKVNETIHNLHRLFQVYEVCVKEQNKTIGKMQFKVYKGSTLTCVIDYILPEGDGAKKKNAELLLKIALKKINSLKINSLDCAVIETQIDADNKASLALFEQQGFKAVDKKPHILGTSIFLQKRM